MEIKAKTLSDAHLKVCKEIFDDGVEIITEDGELTLEYPEPILICIDKPMSDDMISPLCRFGAGAMSKYVKDVILGTDNVFDYDYHKRLFEYETDYGKINQLDYIINKLRECKTTRRAQAITWDVLEDTKGLYSVPCLQRIQFMIRDDKLNMYVDFRSNDCLSALNQNMYAFSHLQEIIALELNVNIGKYYHYIISPHIYHIRDKEEYNKIKLWCFK